MIPSKVNPLRQCIALLGFALSILGCNESLAPEDSGRSVQIDQSLSRKTIRVSSQADVEAPASAVWETVGNFNGWDKFLSIIEGTNMSGQGIGSVRFLKAKGYTAPIVEREELYNEKDRTIAYTILDSPLPVDNYHSVMRVVPVTKEISRIEWSSTFVPKDATSEEARTFIEGFYANGLADLQSLFTPKIKAQKYIPVTADVIWAIVGDFNGLGQFVTDVAESRLVTSANESFRILDFKDGVTQVIERLDNSNPKNTTVTYSIVSAPLPFENYTSTIQIVPEGVGSRVTWSGRYRPIGDPTNAEQFLNGLYTNGLNTLSDLLAP
jgi:ribosome-associated toxin RatA of RatAB toxin-antitoxin module